MSDFVLVPREPTQAMLDAAMRREDDEPPSDWGKLVPASHAEIYRAMLAAAPPSAEPVWRLLEANEVIAEGDERYSGAGDWTPLNGSWIGCANGPAYNPIRRRYNGIEAIPTSAVATQQAPPTPQLRDELETLAKQWDAEGPLPKGWTVSLHAQSLRALIDRYYGESK
jgi:hypothetical protein